MLKNRGFTIMVTVVVVMAIITGGVYFVRDYLKLKASIRNNTTVIIKAINSQQKFLDAQKMVNDVTILYMQKADKTLLDNTITEVKNEVNKIQRSGDTAADEAEADASTGGSTEASGGATTN